MSNKKTRYTFMEFVKEYSIRIPLIQRDYVQGHDFIDKHKLEKRQEFIRLLMNALKRGAAYHVDFIYGSSIQNKEILGGKNFFFPLDGQQRLTTLFLLHWILISKSNLEKDEKIKYLSQLEGFSYETRLSSAAFCDKLTKTILEELPCGKVREIITDCSWYSYDWDYDPTINNMISMLEAMNSMLEDEFLPFINQMLGNALNFSSSITFDRLDMDEYCLTDGLYIKMNARGKELTTFEHWKALFLQFLEDTYQDGDLISKFTEKIEHDWANLFWVYVKDESNEYPVIDGCFMSFFHYLTYLLYYAHVFSQQGNTDSDYIGTIEQINAVYKNRDNVDCLFAALDFVSKVGKMDSAFFDELFRHGNEDVNETKIRLFSKGRLNLFQRCILPQENEDFDIYEKTLFYALIKYCIKHQTVSVTTGLRNYIRVIRNLLLNTNQLIQSQVNLVSNLRITEFATYSQIIETLSTTIDVRESLSESVTGLGGKNAALVEKSKLDDDPNRDVICWLEDMSFCRGNIRAFNFIKDYPKEIIINNVLKFRDATDTERIRILIASGYKGFRIGGWCSYGDRYFFGKEGRWDILFSRDHENISMALRKFMDADCSIEEYCLQNIPLIHNFKYYALKYKEFLRSAGYWQAKDDENSNYYFAVNGDIDNLDMIALKSYSRSPLLAYHTEPLASIVLWRLIEDDTADIFGHNKLQNCNIYSEKAHLKYFKNSDDVVFSIIVDKKAWQIKVAPEIPQHILTKYHIVNNILSETKNMDLVEVAVKFVKDIVKL